MDNEHEYQHGDIAGAMSVTFANNQTLDDFCSEHVADYNRDRFEAIAIRVFLGKETIITIYALDKIRQEDTTADPNKVPVKKFKITTLSASDLFSYCESFNFTLSTGNYPIADMEVVNK